MSNTGLDTVYIKRKQPVVEEPSGIKYSVIEICIDCVDVRGKQFYLGFHRGVEG